MTQFVILDSKISQITPELDSREFQNLPTPYVLESLNASGQSNMVTTFGFSCLTHAVHFVYTKFVVSSTYLYFSDAILKHTKQSAHTIFMYSILVPWSVNPTFLVFITDESEISKIPIPDHNFDVTSIFLFYWQNLHYMLCIPCAQKFHSVSSHKDLSVMWTNVHK